MGWKDIESAVKTKDFIWSHTKFNMLRRCPLAFEKRYIEGKRTPPTYFMHMGSSVDAGINKNYLSKFKKKVAAKLGDIKDAVDTYWKANHSGVQWNGKNKGKLKDVAYKAVEAHAKTLAPSVMPLVEPQHNFTIQVPGLKRKLQVIIDVVGTLRGTFKVWLADNKTVSRAWNQLRADVEPQLSTYGLAWKIKTGQAADGYGIDQVKWNDKAMALQKDATERIFTGRTAQSLVRIQEAMQTYEKMVDSGIFPPTDNDRTCMQCGYNRECHMAAFKQYDAKKYTPDSGVKA